MAFVPVPKDLTKVKTKVALNLTKRQLVCFGLGGLIGIPAYLFSRGSIGNESAALLMMRRLMKRMTVPPMIIMTLIRSLKDSSKRILF